MQAVAAYKAANGGSIYDASREAAVLARVETTASAPHKTATMLFAQIQMDLAKTLQAAWQSLWKKTDSAAQASESLDALRDELNGLGDAIAADLVSLRSRNNCPANELETALRESLDSLEAPVAQETLVRHARMLAAAACSSAVKR